MGITAFVFVAAMGATSSQICAEPSADQAVIALEGSPMVPLCGGVYADPATTPVEQEQLKKAYSSALLEVVGALGEWKGQMPGAIFCKSQPCRQYFAGPASRSWAVSAGESVPGGTWVAGSRPTVVILRVDSGTKAVTAHEMVHLQLGFRMPDAIVPQWFHEGLAAHLSNAPDCSDRPSKGIEDLRRLDPSATWAEYTSSLDKQHATYCQARDEVATWIHRRGSAGLGQLLGALAGGGSFYELYGPLQGCTSSFGCAGPLGGQPAARIAYFPLDELAGRRAADPLNSSAGAWLEGNPVRVPGRRNSAIKVHGGSFVRTEGLTAIGVIDQPLSLGLWVKPESAAKVLIHGSANPLGGKGWCVPFLGFDTKGHLVGQILYGRSPTAFLAAVGPTLAVGKWSHAMMTWGPTSGVRLYVNGQRVGTASPVDATQRHFFPRGGGSPLYLSYGSNHGDECWQNAIEAGDFDGSLDDLNVFNFELSPAQVIEEWRRAGAKPKLLASSTR